MELLNENMNMIRDLCMKHRVGRLFVFGSYTGASFHQGSDIDLLVSFKEMSPEDYADNYFDFKFSLEDLFRREVDLLEEKAVRNPYLQHSIDSTKKLIYEA